MVGYNDVLEICLDIDEESDDCILFLGPPDPSTIEPSDTDDMSLCAETKMLWPKFKSKLTEVTVAFLDEFPHPVFDIKKTIKSVVNEWTLGTRISFKFIEDRSKADIRISNRRGGSWSAIGTAARKKSIDKPTMNLDLPEDSTEGRILRKTLHEFGHALGFIHEHSSPKCSLRFKEQEVIEYYKQHGKTEKWVQNNILRKYKEQYVMPSTYDRLSIMHYTIKKEFNEDNEYIGTQIKLSEKDKEWVKEVYPLVVGRIVNLEEDSSERSQKRRGKSHRERTKPDW